MAVNDDGTPYSPPPRTDTLSALHTVDKLAGRNGVAL